MSVVNELRERVTIQQQVNVADTFGGQTITWSELATVFAAVEPVQQSAREQSLGEQVSARAGYRVRMRWRDDVNASMRLLWKTHVLEIHALHEVDGMMELLTYEEQL